MKKKKTVYIILSVLLIIVAVLSFVHFSTRESVPDGAILVRQDGEDRYIDPNVLFQTQVSGVIVNGKGEERSINSRGAAIEDLANGGFETVTVFADDEYSAQVAADETENAFLILNDDGSVQLVVFGDTNSKRAVRNVVRIEFE